MNSMKVHSIGSKSLVYGEVKKFLLSPNILFSDDSVPQSQDQTRGSLDLSAKHELWSLPQSDVYVIFAGITDVKFCENNSEFSYFINVKQTKILIDILSDMGGKVIFPSTNLVFDGTQSYVSADSATRPRNLYAKQKVEIEEYIMSRYSNYGHTILRLTHVWSENARFIKRWEEERLQNIPIFVSTNRLVSPILPQMIANNLSKIFKQYEFDFMSKILQVSGTFEVPYSTLAKNYYGIRGFTNVIFDEKRELANSSDGYIHNSLENSYQPDCQVDETAFFNHIWEARVKEV